MKKKLIYVELPIHSSIENVWEFTQTPELHEQWDLRFSSITYTEKEQETQTFLYKTNIGLGVSITGWGKSVSNVQEKDGSRISSLHFGTAQKISLIKEGKGYWKYEPISGTTRFLTQYDYEVRFGWFGLWFDKFLFRPAIGWATALSFDVLKRWIEKGLSPKVQYAQFFIYWLLSYTFSFIWIYQGLVPKLIAKHPEEIAMLRSVSPITFINEALAIQMIGLLEITFGGLWLVFRRKKILLILQCFLLPVLLLLAIWASPSVLIHPFSPVSLTIVLLILSGIAFIVGNDVPTAKSCIRSRKDR
ncbi:DoxX-like family protein [Chengkuizengella axinellae]|uniref:DoxX-like family protein n=1 Tax=Chengkuizengella axinellae TaxID=3064388 RepID=A0ABT9IY48_9BACL|nr:DoxX-like family protein [Chengkuizengella sp. 2205SS18-9]MDP5274250.1 DoxX-like family protein [Chengkuizengella sp. 2205SS18-9]